MTDPVPFPRPAEDTRRAKAIARNWNVLVKTRGGSVSLMKGLTKDEARGVMQRTPISHDPWGENPWSDSRIGISVRETVFGERPWYSNGYSYSPSNSDITEVQCWGPNGATLEVWPKPKDYTARYAAALEAAKAKKAAEEAELSSLGPTPHPTAVDTYSPPPTPPLHPWWRRLLSWLPELPL